MLATKYLVFIIGMLVVSSCADTSDPKGSPASLPPAPVAAQPDAMNMQDAATGMSAATPAHPPSASPPDAGAAMPSQGGSAADAGRDAGDQVRGGAPANTDNTAGTHADGALVPSLTVVMPSAASAGERVTAYGENLASVSDVVIDGQSTGFMIVSSTQLQFLAPSTAMTEVRIEVVSGAATSNDSSMSSSTTECDLKRESTQPHGCTRVDSNTYSGRT
jgi:hypothetical protein